MQPQASLKYLEMKKSIEYPYANEVLARIAAVVKNNSL